MNQAIVTKKQMITISYVIGAVFFWFFASKIGDNGTGYMAVVLELLGAFLFLISEEITDFVAKMIRGKKTKGLYKDANNVRSRVLGVHFVMGIVLTLLFLVLSEVLAGGLCKIPYIGICMRILSPVLFLKSMETVFLGSFQSTGSQMPAVLSAFMRQIFFLGFGILLIVKCINYGEKVSGLLVNEDFKGMYGAIGLCVAIVSAELVTFLFQLFLFIISERKNEQNRCKEGLQTTEDLRTTLQYYLGQMVLIFFSQLFYRLPVLFGILFSLRTLKDPFLSAYSVGSFYGPFLILCSVPVMLVEVGTYVMQEKLAQYVGKRDKYKIRECMGNGLHYCMIFAVFFGMLFFTLSGQLTAVLLGGENDALAKYVKLGSVFVVLRIFANFGMGLLKSMNQTFFVLLSASLGALASFISCLIGRNRGFEVYDYMLYSMLFAALVCAITSISTAIGSKRIEAEPVPTFVVPLGCGSIVGLLMMLISMLMTPHLGNFVCLLLCVIFGFILYVFLLGLTHNIHEDEISTMYGELGRRIVGLIFK